VTPVRAGHRFLPALIGALALAAACGSGTDGSSSSPSETPAPPGAGGDGPTGPQAEAPGPWAPSRALSLDRFALETALGSALQEPAGAEYSDSTVWTLSGADVELRLEVRTWFDGAEAEMQCRTSAGSGAAESLSLGSPVWTAPDAVYLTQDGACVRVSVARGSVADAAGAAAVAAAMVSGG